MADLVEGNDPANIGFPGYVPGPTFAGDQPQTVAFVPPDGATAVLFALVCDGHGEPYKVTAHAVDSATVTYFAGDSCLQPPDLATYSWPLTAGQPGIASLDIQVQTGMHYELAVYVHY